MAKKNHKRNCKHCKQEFTAPTHNRLYCSRECKLKAARKRGMNYTFIHVCCVCQKEIPSDKPPSQKHCSDECYRQAVGEKGGWSKHMKSEGWNIDPFVEMKRHKIQYEFMTLTELHDTILKLKRYKCPHCNSRHFREDQIPECAEIERRKRAVYDSITHSRSWMKKGIMKKIPKEH